ncbi:MAG TPA: phosphohydrolase [Gammaproteobacteria bacterium]|jgi:(p)ppGpp synthase/HD superfamily hydrolase|nr:phosphohydrolase [Gammaproteobacteria bacterium]
MKIIEQMTIDQKACRWAIDKHKETNHLYDGKSYEVHLWQVVDVAKMFIHLVPEKDREFTYAVCWLHDTIEDCRISYNDIRIMFGVDIAEAVYALTNEKGRNRKERANEKYYEGIRNTKGAAFVKICDRIANVKHSYESGNSMFKKYIDENEGFMLQVDSENKYRSMWIYLQSFLNKTI